LLLLALVVLAGVIGLVVSQNLDTSDTPETTDPAVSSSAGATSAEQTSAEQTTDEQTSTQQTSTESTESTTSTATSTTSAAPEVIVLDSDDYFGRPLDEVTAELEGLGLVVEAVPVEDERVNNGQIEENTVGRIKPEGEVQEGDVITVPYAVPVPEGNDG
jgi:serine/threonine-protein kinase